MAECIQGITIPPLLQDNCNGETKSTDCIIHSNAITYLGLPANSNLTTIISTLLLSLKDARDRVIALEARIEDHETRITNLEP